MAAREIIARFPPHEIYVEPYLGAGSVFFAKPPARLEVINDLDSQVVNVFRVLRDPDKAARLTQLLALTPFAREELEDSYSVSMSAPVKRLNWLRCWLRRRSGTLEDRELKSLNMIADCMARLIGPLKHEATDDVEAARRLIARSYMGMGSDAASRNYLTGFRAHARNRGAGSHPAQEWASYPHSIHLFCARLSGVCIENREACEVIRSMDAPGVLIYVDPPYVHATRSAMRGRHGYRHEMSDEDHRALAQVLNACRGYVALSGYASTLYHELFPGWTRHTWNVPSDRGGARMECLWLNSACERAQRQMSLGLQDLAHGDGPGEADAG